jgi:hypothetical protein
MRIEKKTLDLKKYLHEKDVRRREFAQILKKRLSKELLEEI